MKKQDPRHVCAESWCNWLAFGNHGSKRLQDYTLDTIEPDGRKQKALVRMLRIEGLVEPVDPENPTRVIVTSKAYDTLTPVKPDLTQHIPSILIANEHTRPSDYDFDKARPGVAWFEASPALTVEEKRWILEHPSDYQIGSWHRITGEWVPGRPGEQKGSLDWAKLVCDAAYTACIAELRFEAKMAELMPRNIAWALVTAGFAEEADADVFKANAGGPFDAGVFGKDPARWGDEVTKRAAYLEARIERDRRHAAALRVVAGRVEAAGGWAKFAQDYRERLTAEIKKESKS